MIIRTSTTLSLHDALPIYTFTNVGKALSSTDIHFNNKLVGRINSFMNATLNLDFVYDDDYSEDWQVAQVLSLGVSFNLRKIKSRTLNRFRSEEHTSELQSLGHRVCRLLH